MKRTPNHFKYIYNVCNTPWVYLHKYRDNLDLIYSIYLGPYTCIYNGEIHRSCGRRYRYTTNVLKIIMSSNKI